MEVTNQNVRIPLTANFPNNQKPSDYWMKSAAYLRLANVQFGYSLNSSMLKRIKLSQARVFVSADNFFQFDNFWKGWDPQAPAGAEATFYPQAKILSIGLDVKF